MMKHLKPIYPFILFLVLVSGGLLAQTSDMARPGPKGIYVFLGKNVASGKIISAYRIERKAKDEMWKQIAEVKAPASFTEFNSRLEAAKALLPVQTMPLAAALENIYRQAMQYGTTDSVKGWRNEYPLRLALGIMYHDADIKSGKEYQYRVTSLNTAGQQENVLLSNNIQLPFVNSWDAVNLAGTSLDDKSLYIRWISIGNSPPPLFMVLKNESPAPLFASGKTIRYTIHDTTYYVFWDSLFSASDQRQEYFLTPYDNFGNSGVSTEMVAISKDNFSGVFFKRPHATKISDRLGIKVSWDLSQAATAKSIDILRSEQPDRNFTLLVSLSNNDSIYMDEKITPDKVYYYKLQANSALDKDVQQSNIFFAVSYDPSKPLPPAIIAAVGIKGGVKLYIDATDNKAAGVRIFRNNGFTDTLTAISGLVRKADSSRIVFTDTSSSLSGRNTYSYSARTESSSYVLSDMSANVSARPLIIKAPSNPSALKAYVEDGMVKLSWENMAQSDPAIAGYIVKRRILNVAKNDESSFVTIAGSARPYISNFISDSSVIAGNTYMYEIQAVDIDNNRSTLTTRATVEVREDLPVAPGSITLINVAEGVRVEWAETIYKGMKSYKLYRYQRGISPSLISVVPSAINDFTDKTALAGQLYFYYLTTINSAGKESIRSQEAGITR